MAAILCKPIGACFEFLFTAPCKACSGCCSLCADGIAGLCRNPLSAFVFVTCAFQIPMAVFSAFAIPGLMNGCKGSQWLVGMLGTAIAHIFTSFYLASRVANKTDEKLRDLHTSWERIKYLLCHDPWMAIYILIVIFYMVWLVVGSGWVVGGNFYDCDLESSSGIVLAMGWAYLFIGPSVLSCNICCACCDKSDYSGNDADFAQAEEQKKTKKQSATSSNNNTSGEAYHANDVESPAEPMYYSTDGTPITNTAAEPVVVEAEVVIEETTLPPAMKPPPAKKDNTTAEKAKATAEKAAVKAQETAGKAVKSFGTWYNNKKKKGSDVPERKANVY